MKTPAPTMISPTGITRSSFSLIEVLLVVGLIALVMGLAAVSFRGVSAEGRFRHGVNGLVKHVDTLRHRAVTLQKPLRLVYDIPENSYWAELLPSHRDELSEEELEELRLIKYYLPEEMVFEEVQLGPDNAEASEAISFDIDTAGMVATHHIYLRQDNYAARIEVQAVSGLVETVIIDEGRLADNWLQPSLGDD